MVQRSIAQGSKGELGNCHRSQNGNYGKSGFKRKGLQTQCKSQKGSGWRTLLVHMEKNTLLFLTPTAWDLF